MADVAPKTAPRPPKRPPKEPQDGPREPENCLGGASDGSSEPRTGPSWATELEREALRRSKTAQMAP
eukprot:8876711-Pyramimonas_sp.AAC.1